MIEDKKTLIIVAIIIAVLGIGAGSYMLTDKNAAEVSMTVSGEPEVSSNDRYVEETLSGMDAADLTVSQNDEAGSVSENLIKREKVRGIYVTGPMAGNPHMDDLIQLVDETCLNTMVIDIKDDQGSITYAMSLSENDIGAARGCISDMEGLMERLKEHDIYTIARISCFKDPYLATKRPELALKKADGSFVTDTDNIPWGNPY